MRVLAVQEVRALVPAPVIVNVSAFFGEIEEQMRRSSEILLAMGEVAFRPLVLLVNIRTEAGLIKINHERVQAHGLLKRIQILPEFLIVHQISNRGAFLRTKRQWINFLFLLVKRLYSLDQVTWEERVQTVRCSEFPVGYNQWAVEVRGAVYLKLVGESVAREPVAVALQEQDMETYFFSVILTIFVFLL